MSTDQQRISLLTRRVEIQQERLLQQRERFEARRDEQAEHHAKDAERERVAVSLLLAAGVTMGAPIEAEESGCDGCSWHIETEGGEDVDGGQAYVLLSNLKDGRFYPATRWLVLRAVVRR